MKNSIRPDAFIAPVLERITIDTAAPSLKARFQEDYKEHLQRLWYEFLVYEKIRAYARAHPLLLKPLDDTPLSPRAKNCLRAAGVEIVADITLYSPSELRLFRNMGEKTVREIEEFVRKALTNIE